MAGAAADALGVPGALMDAAGGDGARAASGAGGGGGGVGGGVVMTNGMTLELSEAVAHVNDTQARAHLTLARMLSHCIAAGGSSEHLAVHPATLHPVRRRGLVPSRRGGKGRRRALPAATALRAHASRTCKPAHASDTARLLFRPTLMRPARLASAE